MRQDRLDVDRALPVPELAHVEIARLGVEVALVATQPKKMSLEACISRWPSTTRRPWFAKRLRSCGSVRRYVRTTPTTAPVRAALPKLRCRAAISKLAARRLTSHSNGPGSVSSKSLGVEDEVAFRRREAAEIGEVRVARELRLVG